MKTKDMVLVAMFTAIIAVLGIFPPINLGFGVPITLQSLGIMLAGCILGRKLGSLSVILFLLLVAVGLPLLAGGRGGFVLFFGPTGGYLLSFIVVAYLIGLFTERLQQLSIIKLFIINALIGALLCNLIGGTFMAYNLHMPLMTAYKSILVFIPGDLLKALLAAVLGVKLREVPQIRRYLNHKAV